MDKKIFVLILALAVVFSAANVFATATTDKTASVTATATITPSTSLSVSPSAISFSTVTTDSYASSPITVTFSSNYVPWKIAIYTNNTQVKDYVAATTTTAASGRYQKGGLATSDGLSVQALRWAAVVDSSAPAIANIASYNYIKDKNDTASSSTSTDSWDSSFASGYCTVAWGNGVTLCCVDPTKSTAAYVGDTITAGEFYVYVAGLFSSAPGGAGTYSSSIGFDLYHE